MNLFRSTALLLFVATSATAQRDTIDEDNGYIKFLRQVHGEKSHDDHQHLLMDHANVKAPDLKDSLGKFSRVIEIEEASFFENLVRNISSDQLVVIEVVGRYVYQSCLLSLPIPFEVALMFPLSCLVFTVVRFVRCNVSVLWFR